MAWLYCLLAGWGVPARRTFVLLAVVAASLVVRLGWADDEEGIKRAVENIDLDSLAPVETAHVTWSTPALVLFDGADRFSRECCLHFEIRPGRYTIKTFVYRPQASLSVLVHAMLRE